MSKRVVVTGMGIVSPLGNDVASYWSGLCAGRSGIRTITHFDTEKLGTKFAGMAEDVTPAGMEPKEIRRHSRNTLFAVEAANQALAQSGIDIGKEDPFRCGVLMGSGIGGIEVIYEHAVNMHVAGPRRVSPLMVPTGIANSASGVVAQALQFMGPNKAVVTACATGAHAIGDAADLIRLGKAEVMLAGGTEATIIPYSLAGFGAMRALSTRNDAPEKASRPFDKERDGFVMGEGAGAVILESEEHAKARGAVILGEVAALGESCDAYHIAAPREDGAGPIGAMKMALQLAQVRAEEIGYFNAHGTSTQLNEPCETRGLLAIFGPKEQMPLVSSTKSMTGHLLGAAGAIEAIACLLAIRDGIAPPNINFETPDPNCDVNLVANTAREAKIDVAMSNSLGFGGHNASLILRRYV
jgi:3-oxoacyl-[acyl-carrier-protein] synthase II